MAHLNWLVGGPSISFPCYSRSLERHRKIGTNRHVEILDFAGVAVFAISGSLAAGQRQMDLFGVLVLATVTAIGGGTLRDLLLNTDTIFWIEDPIYIAISVAAGAVTMLIVRLRKAAPFPGAVRVADAGGLALFAVLGADTATSAGVHGSIVVVMGVMTAVAGGIIRDLLSGRAPLILRDEIYATAAVLGALTYVVLIEVDAGRSIALLIGALAALILRLAAIRWNLTLPTFSID